VVYFHFVFLLTTFDCSAGAKHTCLAVGYKLVAPMEQLTLRFQFFTLNP